MEILISLLLFSVLCLIIIFGLNLFYALYLKVPMVSSNRKSVEKILSHIDLRGKKKFYDLGSGSGKMISEISRLHPELECIGIEYNIAAYYSSKLRNLLSKQNIIYKREDFFKTDLDDADILYVYLYPGLMKRLEPKFSSELKKGALVIVNSFPLKNRTPLKTLRGNASALDTLYVYEY